MAVIVGANANIATQGVTSRLKYTWTPLANGDTGDALNAIDLPDKSVSVSGTFGSGGSVSLQDANGNTYSDAQGNALTFTAAGMKYILENFSDIHPNVTAGDGTTSLTVVIEATNPARSLL